MKIPRRKLGKTGVDVSLLGLGGEGILRTVGYEKEAYRLINKAIDLGIEYFESARAYSGSESYYGLALGERRKDIFLASKSHARDRKGALDHLQETLKYMNTDHLDLWQIHDVRTDEDVRVIFGPDGAMEAFFEAKEKGLVRFIGVTGHHNPSITISCMESFDFDTVLVPVNPAETSYRSFVDSILQPAKDRNMGVIAMKVYLRGLAARIPGFKDLEPFFRYALSHSVTTAVIGAENLSQLDQNIGFAQKFMQMPPEEMRALEDIVAPHARKLMTYKP